MSPLLRTIVFSSVVAGAVAMTATPASSENFMHGSFCTGVTSADRAALLVNHFHAANNDATSARSLLCPFLYQDPLFDNGNQAAAETASIQYFDRSSTQTLSCRMEVTSVAGALVASPERHSCASAGGCASASDALFNSAQMRSLTLDVANLGTFVKQSFRCSVPARTSSGVSGVSDFNVDNLN